jgi:membrane protease YdiL (CAAX protease family)
VFGLHPWHSRWYVRLNAGATSAALAVARLSGLTAADIGLGRGRWLPGRLGSGLAAGAGAGWLLIAVVPATRPLLGDERAAGLDGRAVAYQALVRIPIGTAVWEETAFRGVLQAALRRVMSDTAAIVVTSAAFGLWHIRPTLQALRVNGLAATRRQAVTGTCAGVAGTAAAGALLSWLRARSGRLAAPVLLHVATNSGGLIAAHAVAAHRRRGSATGGRSPEPARPRPRDGGTGPQATGGPGGRSPEPARPRPRDGGTGPWPSGGPGVAPRASTPTSRRAAWPSGPRTPRW